MANSKKARYPALRIIAAWYKVFGYLVGGILALSGLIALVGDGDNGFGIGMMVGAIIFIILSVAVAEVIQVFLDTETNTRHSAESLTKLVELQQKAAASTPPEARTPSRRRPAEAQKATPDQAVSIRSLIRNLHADGSSSEEIATELRNEGMPTLDGSPTWTAQAVETVLREQ